MKSEFKPETKLEEEQVKACEELLGHWHETHTDLEVAATIPSFPTIALDMLVAHLTTKEHLETWEAEILGMCKLMIIMSAAADAVASALKDKDEPESEPDVVATVRDEAHPYDA